MIYISLTVIPSRIQNLNKTVNSLLKQTKKPDKIFINIPFQYKRFTEIISDDQDLSIFELIKIMKNILKSKSIIIPIPKIILKIVLKL